MDAASVAIVIAAVATPAFFGLFAGLALSRGPMWAEGEQTYELNRRRLIREGLAPAANLRDSLFDLYRDNEKVLQFLSAAYGLALLTDLLAIALTPWPASVSGVPVTDGVLAVSLGLLFIGVGVTLFALAHLIYGTNRALELEENRRLLDERFERFVENLPSLLAGLEKDVQQRVLDLLKGHTDGQIGSAQADKQRKPGEQRPASMAGSTSLTAQSGSRDRQEPAPVPVAPPGDEVDRLFPEGAPKHYDRVDDFYSDGCLIHERREHLWVAAHCPGLLVPTLAHESEQKKRYFDTIWSRLEGKGSYTLDYMFDTDGLTAALRGFRSSGTEEYIAETRNNLERALGAVAENKLHLRHATFEGALHGRVIAGEDLVAVGIRRPGELYTSNWTIVRDRPNAEREISRFNETFGSAKQMTLDDLDSIIGSLPPPRRGGAPLGAKSGSPPKPPTAGPDTLSG